MTFDEWCEKNITNSPTMLVKQQLRRLWEYQEDLIEEAYKMGWEEGQCNMNSDDSTWKDFYQVWRNEE